MKETVHKNKYYRIEVNKAKNYLLIKPIGFWRSPDVVPNYLQCIEDTIKFKLSPKFSVILDTSDMLTHPREVQEKIHSEGLKLIKEYEPLIWVKTLPKNDIVAIMQSDHLARTVESSKEVKVFSSVEEAESYLDKYKATNQI